MVSKTLKEPWTRGHRIALATLVVAAVAATGTWLAFFRGDGESVGGAEPDSPRATESSGLSAALREPPIEGLPVLEPVPLPVESDEPEPVPLPVESDEPEGSVCEIPPPSDFRVISESDGMTFVWEPIPLSVVPCAGPEDSIRYEMKVQTPDARNVLWAHGDPTLYIDRNVLSQFGLVDLVCVDIRAYITIQFTSDWARACEVRS